MTPRGRGWRLAAAGAWLAAVPGAAAQGHPEGADTVPPDAVVESEYAFSSGPVTLIGTLTRPRDTTRPTPAVLIVADSGPTDRNGNLPPTVRTNLYAQLAWGLAERGVASLRYDKRGLPSMRGALDRARTTFDDYALDVKAAAAALREDARFTIVALLGHGQGAALAIRAINAGAPVAGAALLAATGRPLLEVIRERLAQRLDSAALEAYDTAMTRYLAGDAPSEYPAELASFFAGTNREFLSTAAAFDPLVEIAHAPPPVLIVHGRRDAEVSEQDAELLSAARPDARFVVLAAANHVFKRAASTGLDAQRHLYGDPAVPVVAELVDVLVEWVRALP